MEEDPNTFRVEGRAPSSPPVPVPGSYGYPPEPPVTGVEALRSFVDRFKHRVVLLDFWASWCNRCRAEMPQIVRLQEDLRASGFQVISVNLDEPSEWTPRTQPLLRSVNGNFPCVVVPREEKAGVRRWLASDWSYALPARFVLDGEGRIIARLFDSASVDQVRSEVERAVRGSSLARPGPSRGPELRARVIVIANGESITVPTIYGERDDGTALARKLVPSVIEHVDSPTKRIAVLPFDVRSGLESSPQLGMQTADATISLLRQRGYLDVVEPQAARREIDRISLTPMAIEFDPSAVQGKLPFDYLVIGWLRGPSRTRGGEAPAAMGQVPPTPIEAVPGE